MTMAPGYGDVTESRLFRLAQHRRNATIAPPSPDGDPSDAAERCELCSAPIDARHRHLLDTTARRLLCSCRACSMLFAHGAVGRQQLRLVPEEVRQPDDLVVEDSVWAALAIPVDIAFFFFDTAADRTVALYPSALGVTESRLALEAWAALVQRSVSLRELAPDVEALLVNRTRGAREQWIVPVDQCYRLAGLVRTHWKGLGGGPEVWAQLDHFLDELRRRARRVATAKTENHQTRSRS